MRQVPHEVGVSNPLIGQTVVPEQQYTYEEIFTGGMELESSIINLGRKAFQEKLTPDPDFDVVKALEGNPLGLQYPEQLGAARSKEELNRTIARINREVHVKQMLASSGLAGFVAGAIGGIMSPTTLMPILGAARGLKGAAQSFALAGTAAGFDEATLSQIQETRTTEEALTGVAVGTVLGGLLGVGVQYLSPAARARIESGMAPERGQQTILHTAEDGSTSRVDFDTIRTRDAPNIKDAQSNAEENARGTFFYTVYTSDGVPTLAKIIPTEKSENIQFEVDGVNHTLGKYYFSTPVEDGKTTLTDIPGNPAVKDLNDAELIDAMDVVTSQLVTEGSYAPNAQSLIFQKNVILAEGTRRYAKIKDSSAAERFKDVKPNEVEATLATDQGLFDLAREWKNRSTDIPPLQKVEEPIPLDEISPLGRADEEGEFEAAGAQRANPTGRRLAVQNNAISRSIIRTLKRLTPVHRIQDNPVFESPRRWMARIITPNRLEGNIAKQPTAVDGDIVSRIGVNQTWVADAIISLDDAYARHLLGKSVTSGTVEHSWFQQVKGSAGLVPPGKMTRKEFMKTVFMSAQRSDTHADPTVNLAVTEFRKYFDRMNALHQRYFAERQVVDGDDAAPLYDELSFDEDTGDIQNYIHHMYDTNSVISQSGEFLKDVADHGEGILRANFQRSFNSYEQTRTGIEHWQNIIQLPAHVRDAQYAKTIKQLDDISAALKPAEKRLRDQESAMRQAGIDADEIKAASASMRESFGPHYSNATARKRALNFEKQLYEQAGAGLTAKQAKIFREIHAIEELQERALIRVMDYGARFRKLWDNNSDKKLDAAQQKAWDNYAAELKKLANYDRRIEALESDSDIAKIDRLEQRAVKTEERVHKLLAKAEKLTEFDRDFARELLIDQRGWFANKFRALDNKRIERVQQLREKAEQVDPVKRSIELEKELQKSFDDLEELTDNFETTWRKRGGEDVSARRGEVDFRNYAEENAVKIYKNITGNPHRIVGLDILQSQRGAELQRALNLPLDIKTKYLITDPERIVRAHSDHLLPDLELYRITGSPNGAKIFDELDMEHQQKLIGLAKATHVKGGRTVLNKQLGGEPVTVTDGNVEGLTELTPELRAKFNQDFDKLYQSIRRDMTVVIDRLRHSRGIPDDPNGFAYRLGKSVSSINVFRQMGTVVPSSIPDFGRPIFHAGLTRTFQRSWVPMISDWKQIKAAQAEGQRMGLSLDPLLHTRMQAIFDLGENYSTRQSKAERALELLAQKTGLVALFDQWNAKQKALSANVLFGELGHHLRTLVEGTPGKELDKAKDLLHFANIGDDMAHRIWDQFNREGGSTEFSGGHRLPNTEAWDDWEATMAFRAGMFKLVNDTIITPSLDRPSWVDANMAFKLLAQFRSYTLTATMRIIMSGAQKSDMALVQGAIFSVALGALSYYTWAVSRGGTSLEKAMKAGPEQWLYESFSRSGLLGVLGDVQRVGEQIPLVNDLSIFGGEGRATRQASSLLGSALGPSYDLAERLASVIQGMDSPTQSTLHSARTMGVYQNVFYLTRGLSAVERGLADILNLPESRSD